MARTYEFVIGRGETGMRLDHYLSRRLPSIISRAMVQRVIREGDVTIAGRTVKVHQRLREGDRITAYLAAAPARPVDTVLTPQPIPLDIVYEDDQLLVVNKPAGLVTHPAPGHWDGTLVNAVLWHLSHGRGAGDKGRGKEERLSAVPTPHAPRPTLQLARAGIVHRLDKDTSGLLMVAKTETAHTNLSRQLKMRTIRRRYVAVAEGVIPLDAGTITVPIGRHLRHRKEMTIRHLGGRAAVTHYRVLKRLYTSSQGQKAGDGGRGTIRSPASLRPVERESRGGHTPHPTPPFPYTVLELSLETGRTHQIRVHLAHMGYPVAGDTMYGKHPASFWHALGIGRQLLHAVELSFRHPATQQPLVLTAPIPKDMMPWVAEGDQPRRRP